MNLDLLVPHPSILSRRASTLNVALPRQSAGKSQAKSSRDGNDEAENDLREWIEIGKILQSSDRDEGEVRL